MSRFSLTPNRSFWPWSNDSFCFWIFATSSGNEKRSDAILPYFAKAPTFISDSRVFLFTFLRSTLFRKSVNEANSELPRTATIESIAADPTFFIAESPKRIQLPSIENPALDLFMSGGKTGIFSVLHS